MIKFTHNTNNIEFETKNIKAVINDEKEIDLGNCYILIIQQKDPF